MNDTYKILHLEDVLTFAELVARELKKSDISFEHYIVDNEKDYKHALACFAPDIILCDHSLPSFNSLDALKILKAKNLSIPFILITANMTDDVAMSVVSEGADDYILKDRLQRLPHAVVNAIEKFRLIKEQQIFVAELVKNEKRFRALVENGVDAVLMLNAEGKVTYASPAATKVFGYTDEEVMRMDLVTIAHPDDVLALANIFAQVLTNPGIAMKGHTGRMLHKDGSWRWLEATVTNLLHDPAINGIVHKFRDVTERKLAEHVIADSEEKYRSFFENSMDGILLTVTDGDIFAANPAACKIFQMTEEEICKAGRFGLVDNTDPRLALAIKERQLTGKAKADVTLVRKDGTKFPGEITSAVFRGADGGLKTSMIVRDISEQKIAEEKIIQLNRLYAFISAINQTIVHAPDEQTVFKKACSIACEIGKFKVAWIALIDTDKQTINLTASSGLPDEDICKLVNLSYEKNGPHAHIVKSGAYYVSNNTQQDAALENWKPLAAKKGNGSCIFLPIKKSGKIIGSFNLSAAEAGFFTAQEIALLEEATGDISFALDVFEKEKLKLQADELVKHKELRLNQAQAIAHVGSWELDFATGIAVWSDEQLKIHGLNPGESKQCYESWISFIHPEDVDYVVQKTNETKSTISNSAFFYRIIRKDGTIRHLYSQNCIEFNTEGKPIGMYGIAHDVTEIKEAEEALRKSESNLKAIFNSTSEGFVLTDTNGLVKMFNPNAENSIYLNSKQEIKIGSCIYDFIHPSRKDSYKDSITKALMGQTIKYDYSYTRKNGEIKWFDFTINPVYNSGKIEGVSITSSDITERKINEQKLLASSIELHKALADLNEILDSSLDVICSIDGEGKFVSVSAASFIVWGYTADELIGTSFTDILFEEDIEANLKATEELLNGIPIPIVENRYIHKNGKIVPMLWSLKWDEKNQLLFCVGKDVTEKKRLEKAIETERDQFFEMLLNAPTAIGMLKGPDHVFEIANPLYLQLIGKKEVIGKTVAEVRPELIEQGFIEILNSVYTSGKSYTATEILVKIDKEGNGKLTDTYLNLVYQAYKNNEGIIEGIFFFVNDITEQQKAKENLLTTSERLLLATTSVKMGIWDWDIVNDTMIWDDRMYELYGIGAQHFTGAYSVWQNGVHPDDIERAAKELNDAIKGERDFDTEFRVMWPDKSIHFIEAHAIVSRDEAGVGVRMIGGNIDITERKAGEEKVIKLNEEVAKSEKFFKAVIENSDDMITILAPTGKTIYASPAVSKKFGYTIEECLALNIADIVHPDDALIMQEFIMKVMMHPSVPMECPLIRDRKKDGTYMWVEGTLTNFLETEGINAIVANFRDITERKISEDENRFKANLLNTIGQAAVATDTHGIINYWNKAAEDIYGWTKDEAIGKNIIDLTTSGGTKEQGIQIIEHLSQGRTWSGEFRVRRKNGDNFPAFVNNSPIYNQQQNLIGIIGISTDITEKKKLEELLDKANNMARIGNYEIDLVKNTLYWSPITEQIHEVENDFIPDVKTGIDFYKSGSSRECITRVVTEAIKNGIPFDVELEIVTAKGNERWVRVIGEAECHDGSCIRVYGSFQDIDKIKKAEFEVLKVYEEKNIILESIGDAFFAVDKSWIVTYWNKQAENNLLVPKREIVGKNLWDVFSDGVDSFYKNYHHAVKTEQAVQFEAFFAPLGKWFGVSAYPSKNGLSVYFKDITEQKQADAAFKQSEYRYRQIVETAQEGIWLIDENNKTTFVNKRMCEMVGYGMDEVIGKTIQTFMDEEERNNSYEQIKRRKKGISENHDLRFITKNGKELWTNMSTNPILDSDGNYKGALAMITDITERKEQEIQIQKNTEERELLIGELTKSLQDLKQFSYITSHNFRAPLSNLMGLLSLIDFESLDENNKEIMEMFKTSTNQLNKTINDLLRILIIRNNVNVDVTNINIRASLTEVCSLLAHEIKENHCTVNLNFSIENLLFNQSYIDSILLNLLSNAIKYRSPKRSLQINVSTNLNTDGKLVLIIQDNGMGIDLNRHRSNMFGLYQRFHSNSDSAGLGLFMVKSQVTSLGGSIDVESEVDKGTAFTITFKGSNEKKATSYTI